MPAYKLSCLVFLVASFSCSQAEVHLHDRHALSYSLVAEFAKKNPNSELVLLDYHHDSGPLGNPSEIEFNDRNQLASLKTTSFNWVGRLLERNLLSRVVWVSGKSLLLPNRNARTKWLHRSLKDANPELQNRISEKIELMDWGDLRHFRPSGPVIVSLDLDLFTKDPGNPPEQWIDELSLWCRRVQPKLTTIATSSAYQKKAVQAWSWLERWLSNDTNSDRNWYLEADFSPRIHESLEELGAWKTWQSGAPEFKPYRGAYWPGTYFWYQIPRGVRDRLLEKKIRPGDSTAALIVDAWKDPSLAALEEEFPESRMLELSRQAQSSLEDYWRKEIVAAPSVVPNAQRGIAVRLLNDGIDRGCLAYYSGVSSFELFSRYCVQQAARDPRYPPVIQEEKNELEIEISIFGNWTRSKNPLDFRVGFDTLLVQNGEQVTLLQASIAVERNLTQEEFLTVLSNKAGLGKDGWKVQSLVWKKAPTLWFWRKVNPKNSS